MKELNLDPSKVESKTRMLEILQRVHENNRIASPMPDTGSDLASNRYAFFSNKIYYQNLCKFAFSDVDLDDIGLGGIGPFSQFVDIEDLEEDLDSDDEDYADITERLAGKIFIHDTLMYLSFL